MNYLEYVKYLLSLNPHKHIVDIEGYYYMFYAQQAEFSEDIGSNQILIESNFSNFPLILSVPYFVMEMPLFNMGYNRENDKLMFQTFLNNELTGEEFIQELPVQIKAYSEAQIYKRVAINTFIYLPAKTTIYTPDREEVFQLCYIDSDIAEKNKNLFKLGGF